MTRILLVDPDANEAATLKASLISHADWEVTNVGSVIEAIRTAGDEKFDAAILDYELPDGTGLDLLNFLRIGSPGIRILMLSNHKSAEVAFHALSHGAGDYLVKDQHLDQELPRRMTTLLEGTAPESALVETLMPQRYEEKEFHAQPTVEESSNSLQSELKALVGGTTLAAGLFDHRGRPIAVRLLPDIDGDGLGFALATIHGQIGSVWTYGNLRPTGYTMLVDVEGGVLGITAIPGTFLVGVLFESPINHLRALEKLATVATRLSAALEA